MCGTLYADIKLYGCGVVWCNAWYQKDAGSELLWLLSPKFIYSGAGGLKDHNFLDTRVDPNRNYIFGTLTLKAIDWYINESILTSA
jgi:hypothetical protein